MNLGQFNPDANVRMVKPGGNLMPGTGPGDSLRAAPGAGMHAATTAAAAAMAPPMTVRVRTLDPPETAVGVPNAR
jgi:hypothetical protein